MRRRCLTALAAALAAIVLWVPVAGADQWVNGYYKKDGTYVQGYWRSTPNATPYDNFSYRGNVNPYTGARGTRSYDPVYPSYRYEPVRPTPLMRSSDPYSGAGYFPPYRGYGSIYGSRGSLYGR